MGNKGGVAARFSLYDSNFCFINSHFASGALKVEKRNQDYKAIASRINFSVGGKQLGIFDHE